MGALVPALSVAARMTGAAIAAPAVTRKLLRVTFIVEGPPGWLDAGNSRLSLVRDRGFLIDRLGIGELQPESHHFFVARFAPPDGLRGIGILRVVQRIIKVRGGHQFRAFRA